MSKFVKRIMVPLDGSHLAESVLPVVALLARCCDSEILLLHIVEDRPPATVHGEAHLHDASDAEEYLERAISLLGPGLRVEKHVHFTQEHDVAASIAVHVEEHDVDLVALCTHGGNDIKRVIWGSIAQQVLRRVRRPVLLVRPGMAIPTSLDGLLVPLDRTRSSEGALDLAGEIAQRCGASVRLVEVVPTVATLAGEEGAAARMSPSAAAATLDAEESEARDYLRSLLETLARAGVRAGGEVRRGETVQCLVRAAEQAEAGMIVIATHARAGFGAFWIGSVAAALANKARQPLLLLRIAEETPRDQPST